MRQRSSGLAVHLAAWLVGSMLTIGCSGSSVVGGNDAGVDAVSDMGVTCSTPQTTCGSSCANLQTDPANCGSCGHACGTTEFCSSGVCVTSCASGLTVCSGACRNTAIDPANCGGCGLACTAGTNATPTCTASACGFTCATGFGNCDGAAANGCEVDLTTSAANCGACGHACAAGAACVAGVCRGSAFVGTINVGNLYTDADPFTEHNVMCAAAYAGSHQCTQADVDNLAQYSTICAAGVGYIIVNDQGLFTPGTGWLYDCYQCPSGWSGTPWQQECNGQPVPCCR